MFVGTCPDMCPEKERFMRETRKQLSIFEVIPDTEMVISINPFFYFQTEDYRVCFFFHLNSTMRCYVMSLVFSGFFQTRFDLI